MGTSVTALENRSKRPGAIVIVEQFVSIVSEDQRRVSDRDLEDFKPERKI